MPSIDDPRFALPAEPPFTPGTSPFRGAGVVYKGLWNFVDQQIPNERERVLAALPTDDLRSFLKQNFGMASFYDLVPLPYFGTAIAQVRHVTYRHQLEDSNRYAAQSKLADVYSALLRTINAEYVAMALPRAVKTLQNFGTCTTKAVSPGRVDGVRTGVPEVLVRWYSLSTGSFMNHALSRSAGKPVNVRFSDPELEETTSAGMRTYSLAFSVLL